MDMRGEYSPRGTIEVITGGMFSGKSEMMIHRLRRAKLAKLRLAVFKPMVDNRYHDSEIVSHVKNSTAATAVQTAADIERLANAADADVVGIDEAQFFEPDLVDVCNRLAESGKRVIVAGLDLDYLGRPFGPMPALMAVSEEVTKLNAICMDCGGPACRSERIVAGDDAVVSIGATDKYQAKCRKHFKNSAPA